MQAPDITKYIEELFRFSPHSAASTQREGIKKAVHLGMKCTTISFNCYVLLFLLGRCRFLFVQTLGNLGSDIVGIADVHSSSLLQDNLVTGSLVVLLDI